MSKIHVDRLKIVDKNDINCKKKVLATFNYPCLF